MLGPDLARPLHALWPTIETHAKRLDNLCRQLAQVRFEIVEQEKTPTLHVIVPLGEDESIRVVLQESNVNYCLVRQDQWLIGDSREPCVDRGVYLMLAALAAP